MYEQAHDFVLITTARNKDLCEPAMLARAFIVCAYNVGPKIKEKASILPLDLL